MRKYHIIWGLAALQAVKSYDPFAQIPLPGLNEKPHLKGLSRENLTLGLLHEYGHGGQPIESEGDPVILTDGPDKSPEELKIRAQIHQSKMKGAEMASGENVVFDEIDAMQSRYKKNDPFKVARYGDAHPMVQSDSKVSTLSYTNYVFDRE